mmetsp:Transcript_22350/g.68807  ORF Transcript_22350/g.68807 Transcript_22350/m.68807 type:complete len:189 (+) Transcript_22350:131-697(+)
MREIVQKLFEFRRAFALLTLVCNGVCAVAFALASLNVVGRCLRPECGESGEPFERVDLGLSFGLLLAGFLFLLQPLYGLWFFKVKCTEVVGGAFVGATATLAPLAAVVCALWSSLARDANVRAVAGLAGLYCGLALLSAFQLSLCLEFFCDNNAAQLRAQRFAHRIRRGYQYQGVATNAPGADIDDDI